MNKKTRRLKLSRETLVRLDEPALRILKGANGRVDVSPIPMSNEKNCMSPLCVPTFWAGCETQ
jgi:hypothetical protein